MTLCVAMMCNQAGDDPDRSMIVGVSDRLYTRGPNSPQESRFEPNLRKFLSPSQATAIMIAGNTEMIAKVLRRVQPVADAAVAEGDWLSVEALAERFGFEYREERQKRLEHAILSRFSLTWVDYKTKPLSADFFRAREEEIAAYEKELPWDECVFAGLDGTGAHVYSCGSDGNVRCWDAAGGWATAGSKGQVVARKYLDKSTPTHLTPFHEALYLAYSAKRKAKARDRHIGSETEVFVVGPGLRWGFYALPPAQLSELSRIYDGIESESRKLESVKNLAASIFDPTQTRLHYIADQGAQQSPPVPKGDS